MIYIVLYAKFIQVFRATMSLVYLLYFPRLGLASGFLLGLESSVVIILPLFFTRMTLNQLVRSLS